MSNPIKVRHFFWYHNSVFIYSAVVSYFDWTDGLQRNLATGVWSCAIDKLYLCSIQTETY